MATANDQLNVAARDLTTTLLELATASGDYDKLNDKFGVALEHGLKTLVIAAITKDQTTERPTQPPTP
jgi:hypothetical protein